MIIITLIIIVAIMIMMMIIDESKLNINPSRAENAETGHDDFPRFDE